MKNTLTVVSVACLMAACGGGGSDSGGGGSNVVSFEVDPQTGPQCYGATDISTFKSSYATSVDCTWYCATYKGQSNRYVSIDFQRRNQSGAVWVKDHEYVSSGIC